MDLEGQWKDRGVAVETIQQDIPYSDRGPQYGGKDQNRIDDSRHGFSLGLAACTVLSMKLLLMIVLPLEWP
jgi:hypothetical protein